MEFTPANVLGPDGVVARRLDGYEHRPQQLEMADAVYHALGEGRHLVVEAGTGVGKSFGYLLPAILRTAAPGASRKRIVISTHTISLQEQLIIKDIPFLNSVLPLEFTAVLAKGRRNYLSRRRMDLAARRSAGLFDIELGEQLESLRLWSGTTQDGSLSDLGFRPHATVWEEVASDSSNCMGKQCPTYATCFYYRARRRVQHAQLMIVNHALFFSDLALRQVNAAILPKYDAVVFDEAHTLESVAAAHLGMRITSGQIEFSLNRLYNDHTNRGLLVTQKLSRAQQQVSRCYVVAHQLFESLDQCIPQQAAGSQRVRRPNLVRNPLSPELRRLSEMVARYGEGQDDPSLAFDFASAAGRLDQLAGAIDGWLRQEGAADEVYWLERHVGRRGRRSVTLAQAPVDVSAALREELFDKVDSVILTSATLTTGRTASFDFIRQRLGIDQARTLEVGSPFDYARQAQIILPQGMPDPNEDATDFQRMAVLMIQRYVERTDGHAFVLFTSYQMLRQSAAQLAPWLSQRELALYSQADGLPRQKLLDSFKRNPRGVLFGTDSFWQGVDVPGDSLVNVIITKLPFSVPDQPLLQARLEAIRQRGGNPFSEYQLPEAIIKLRQGFGRLIRTQRDSGIVVILDPRIRQRTYGRLFLEALPAARIVEEPVVMPLGGAEPRVP